MSDGPHKSLPMSRGWRKVAERADNDAFTAEDVSAAVMPALEQDCRADISRHFLNDVRAALEEREVSLFNTETAPFVDGLRGRAESGMDRAILDNVCAISREDAKAMDILLEAVEAAVSDRAARGARQVEEHYLRESTAPRAHKVRGRLEEAIAKTGMVAIAGRILDIDRLHTENGPQKQSGVDDGVELP